MSRQISLERGDGWVDHIALPDPPMTMEQIVDVYQTLHDKPLANWTTLETKQAIAALWSAVLLMGRQVAGA